MALAVSSMTLKDGLRAARATAAVRMIAYLQIRAAGPSASYWPAVPIARSKGAGLLQWSESTWKRAVREAEQLGWIERKVRSGRVKGNRRGYNPGSLYRVIWSNLPGGRPAKDGSGPLITVAARTREIYNGRIRQRGQTAEQRGQDRRFPNSEPGHDWQQPGQLSDLRTGSDLVPVPYREPGRTAVEGRGAGASVPEALPLNRRSPAPTPGSSPPSDSPEGEPTAEQGIRGCRYHSSAYVCDLCRGSR